MDPFWRETYKRERARIIARIRANNMLKDPPVKGGQGRSDSSVMSDGMAVLFTVGAAVLLIVLIVAERWTRGTP